MLEHRANPNFQRTNSKKTALHLISSTKDCSIDLVKLLLSYKADVTLEDANGSTAYDIAKSRDLPPQILELLESNGQDPVIENNISSRLSEQPVLIEERVDFDENISLLEACLSRNVPVFFVEKLIEANKNDIILLTEVFENLCASERPEPKFMKLLLENGAQPFSKTENTIFVQGIPDNIDADDLQEIFHDYSIKSTFVARNKDNSSKLFGFV